MKRGFLLLVCLTALSCFIQARKYNHISKGTVYVRPYGGGLCSTIITFVSDSIYRSNSGCEGPGHTSYGTYHIKADSLFLQDGISGTALEIIKTDTVTTEDDLLALRFFNEQGENITKKFKAFATRTGNENRYSLSYDAVRNALINRKTGKETVHISTFDLLGCTTEHISMDFPKGKEINFRLYIPEAVIALDLFNKDIASGGQSIYLIRTDSLVSTEEEVYDFGDGSCGKIIFKKETQAILQ